MTTQTTPDAPAPGTDRPRRPGTTVARVAALLWSRRWTVALMLLLGAVGAGLLVIGPLLLGRATDLVIAGVVGQRPAAEPAGLADVLGALPATAGDGVDFDLVGALLATTLGMYVTASLLVLVQGRLAAAVVQRVIHTLRARIESKLGTLPVSYFDHRTRGEVLSRATNDVDNLQQALQETLAQLLTSVLTAVAVLVLMFVISPLLAVLVLVTLPLAALAVGLVARRAQPRFAAQWAATGELNGHVEEMYDGHAVITSCGRADEVVCEFEEHNSRLARAATGAQFLSGTIQPIMIFVGNLSYLLVAVVGGLMVIGGSLSVGSVQAFVQYTAQFTQPIGQLSSVSGVLQSGIASAERIFALLDAPEQSPDPVAPARPAAAKGRIVFDRVGFGYAPGAPLFEDLTVTVEPGSTVAIVGPTGAGKTTLANLLLRFYEVDSGRILLDGVDIATLPRAALRSRIGVVLQDSWLFDGTIADNIAYGRPGATRREVVEAARATHVDHFVRTLPGGYDTVLTADSDTLSEGERQLITVARAFLSAPAVLVLDEATSSVDTRTEALVQRATESLRANCTSLVIAHRLSTIRHADLILVVDRGDVVERGTHEELLERGGKYAELYAAQFAGLPADVT